jgi:phosphoenolpyruvate-protein phosphotransferase (PTS system enzyme I)
MFPMVIGVDDFIRARAVWKACMTDLEHEQIPFDKKIPLGIMVETPSAALCSEQLAAVCDFFSIGTNDLVQYTLAVDRNNDAVADYYVQHHPSVLLLIQEVIKSAHKAGIQVSVCGEMASEPKYVPLFVGMGIDELSISPVRLPLTKTIIRNSDEALFKTISSFNFHSVLDQVEYLLNITLKPYYTIQS